MDVIVFGSAIVDFICYVPRLPNAGETLHGTKFTTGFGGKGANQCVAAAKLGARTGIIAKTTGIAQINVAENGDNQIVIVTGANNLLSADDVEKAADALSQAKVLVCQLETPIPATIAALKSFKGISILNAAPALENTPKELLEKSSIFCVNELEAALMTNKTVKTISDGKEAIISLLEMGATCVIITLGAQGAIYGKKGSTEYIHVQVPQKVEKVVDTTGAGDAFIGSLGFFLAKFDHYPLHQLIGAACQIASISVQHPGTQASFPSLEDTNIDFNNTHYEWCIIEN